MFCVCFVCCGFCSLSSFQNEGLNSNEHVGREQLEPLGSGTGCPCPPGGLIKVPEAAPSSGRGLRGGPAAGSTRPGLSTPHPTPPLPGAFYSSQSLNKEQQSGTQTHIHLLTPPPWTTKGPFWALKMRLPPSPPPF